MLRPECRALEVACVSRRRVRSAVMRLSVFFWFFLLFSTGGLLLLLHRQDLTENSQQQNPGAKLIPPYGQPLSKKQCPHCPDADVQTLVNPVRLNVQSSVLKSRDMAARFTKNYRKLLLRSPSLSKQLSSTPAAQAEHNRRNMTQVQLSRQRQMREICAKYKGNHTLKAVTRRDVSRIYVEDKHKLLYCEVPKVGCSNWKRVLMVLQGQAASTGEIKHEQVHNGKNLKRLDSFSLQGISRRLKTYTKVLSVRDPFERLVSAFRDKFENPNPYYHPVFGRSIISRYRRNATKSALRTGDGVTFKEFIQYLLDVRRPVGMDIHWETVAHLCSPCQIHYNFIGKFETIEEEANFLLKQIGAPANLTFPRFKDRNPNAERTSSKITKEYFGLLNLTERQRTYDFYFMDYIMFNYSKPYDDLY